MQAARLRLLPLFAPATLLPLLLALLSALSLVHAGRLVGYSDVNCQSGMTQATFTPGLCYRQTDAQRSARRGRRR